MDNNIWEAAYKNTTKVVFGIGKKSACKTCNEITKVESTPHRQLIGNCYEFIVKCCKCKKHFVDDNIY